MSIASVTVAESHTPIPLEKGVPILGCLPEMSRDPLKFFKRLATEYEDIVEFRFATMNIALVTSAPISHQILVKEVKNFRKADREISILSPFLGNGLVTNNNPKSHKTQRKLAQPGFHFRRIQNYADTMIAYTDRYIAEWQETESRNIADDMFKLTMYIVSKTLFNIDMQMLEHGADKIGDAMEEIQDVTNQKFMQMFQIPEWVPSRNNRRLKRARAVLYETIEQMLAAKHLGDGKYSDDGDLMSMLLQARYEDGSAMSHQQIMDELITLFAAGHETTSNALSWTFYLLSNHPEIQQKLHEELDQVLKSDTPAFEDLENLTYTEMVIKESMRIFPPAWSLSARQANEDTLIGDYLIPKDKTVFVAPYANHHNPRYFPSPEVFDPERFNEQNEKALPRYAYIPFGAGPRVCIGNSFAMMEAKLLLATIMKRFEIRPAPGQILEPQAQITLSNKSGMPVLITKRSVK